MGHANESTEKIPPIEESKPINDGGKGPDDDGGKGPGNVTKPQPSKTPKVNLDLRGVVGNMQAEPRVFAHDAIPINVSDFGDLLMPPPDFGERTFNRGCCIYAGVESNIQVLMESGRLCTFKRVAPGSFLPILVIKVISAQRINEDGGFSNVSDGDLVSLW